MKRNLNRTHLQVLVALSIGVLVGALAKPAPVEAISPQDVAFDKTSQVISILPKIDEGNVRIWFSIHDRESKDEQDTVWTNVIVRDEDRLVLGLEKDSQKRPAAIFSGNDTAFQEFLETWRDN